MRILLPVMVTAFTFVTVWADTYYLPNLKGASKKISLEIKDEPIESVVRSIVNDPEVSIEFRNIDSKRRVSVSFDKKRKHRALNELASSVDLHFRVLSPKTLHVTQWSHLSRFEAIIPREGDATPPEPTAGSPMKYPELARLARWEARIVVEIDVETDGSVSVGGLAKCDLNQMDHGPYNAAERTDELCPLFLDAATQSLQGWRFEPQDTGSYYVNLSFSLE